MAATTMTSFLAMVAVTASAEAAVTLWVRLRPAVTAGTAVRL
jgi:hypothetical protein